MTMACQGWGSRQLTTCGSPCTTWQSFPSCFLHTNTWPQSDPLTTYSSRSPRKLQPCWMKILVQQISKKARVNSHLDRLHVAVAHESHADATQAGPRGGGRGARCIPRCIFVRLLVVLLFLFLNPGAFRGWDSEGVNRDNESEKRESQWKNAGTYLGSLPNLSCGCCCPERVGSKTYMSSEW